MNVIEKKPLQTPGESVGCVQKWMTVIQRVTGKTERGDVAFSLYRLRVFGGLSKKYVLL